MDEKNPFILAVLCLAAGFFIYVVLIKSFPFIVVNAGVVFTILFALIGFIIIIFLLKLGNNSSTVTQKPKRTGIPSEIRKIVWERDGGKCQKCGSRYHLEFDHIVPVSKGGSNTEKNIELLCKECNRQKHAKIE